MKSKKEKLHIYVRCSTDNQIENSIERQVEDGIKFSKELNMDYQIWNDEGKSGIKSFEDIFAASPNQLEGLITFLSFLLFNQAPHQEKVEFAMILFLQ